MEPLKLDDLAEHALLLVDTAPIVYVVGDFARLESLRVIGIDKAAGAANVELKYAVPRDETSVQHATYILPRAGLGGAVENTGPGNAPISLLASTATSTFRDPRRRHACRAAHDSPPASPGATAPSSGST
jgi:hypothetical protein